MKPKEICSIYLISNNFDDKKWVGQTWGSIKRRFWRHCNEEGCPKLYRAIQKYGKDNFKIEAFLSVWLQEEADYYEEYFITLYDSINNGYNLLPGGGNHRHSPETGAKISKSNTGKKRSEEFCKALSEARKGSGNPMFGKHLSDEHKRKQSEATKGKSIGELNPTAKLTDNKVKKIKKMLKRGITEPIIAAKFGVTRSAISAISQNRSWKHIPWPDDQED
jgi:group I intron endonuclease